MRAGKGLVRGDVGAPSALSMIGYDDGYAHVALATGRRAFATALPLAPRVSSTSGERP